MKFSKQYIFIAAILLWFLIYSLRFEKDYRAKLINGETEIVVGQTTKEYIDIIEADRFLDYNFNYEGRQYAGSRSIRDLVRSPDRFVNKFFPVVVSKKDDGESAILITPNDFAFFDMAFPDSLNWVAEWVVL